MLTAIMASILLCSQKSVATGKPPVQKTKQPIRMEVVATAYSTHPSENGGYSITSTGKKLGDGIIAVDPKVIKMGSKIFDTFGNYLGVAADVGGAIKGRRIDRCFSSRASVGRFGRRKMTIVVVPPSKAKK